MNLLKLLFILSITTSIVVASTVNDSEEDSTWPAEIQETASLRGISRFLVQNKLTANMTCNKFPRICRRKNSGGPDCCKKKCVNVKKDRLNCGMCGHRCKSAEICCKGNCVNAYFDKRNCGGCSKKCKKKQWCVYGMCSYA